MPFSQPQYFSASYDSTTKVLTALVCAIVLAVAIFAAGSVAAGAMIGAGIGSLGIAVAYAWSPRGYMVAEQSVFVKRLIGDAHIPLEAVREVRPATRDDYRGCIRLFGVGGLFGYYGLFRTSKLGKSTWYLTNRANAVVIITAAKTALVSPDDADGFLAAVRNAASVPVTARIDATESYSAASQTGVRIGPLFGVVFAVIALTVAAIAMLYSPGPPSYTLTAESLTIHDRFYPVTVEADNVEVDQIQVVDLDKDSQWRPVRRTNGFANAHYRSGQFRVVSGQTVRLYQAGSRRVVLLPLKNGAAVLLETANPDDFAAEVRQKWPRPS